MALHLIRLTVNILILKVELVAKDSIELLKLFDLSKGRCYVSSDKIEAAFAHMSNLIYIYRKDTKIVIENFIKYH